MSTRPARCAACGADLPAEAEVVPGGGRPGRPVGRPRRYCSQRCRQRAYRDRTGAPDAVPVAPAPETQVTLRRAWLEDLADRVYQLDCAVEDVRTALAEDATRAELVAVCRNLVESAGSLRPALRRLPRR